MEDSQKKETQKDHVHLDKLIQDGKNNIKKHKFKSYNYFTLFILLTICLTSLILIVKVNSKIQTQKPTQIPAPVDPMTGEKSPLPSNQFSDWKTYKNLQYNYSFKYPVIWEAKEARETNKDSTLFTLYITNNELQKVTFLDHNFSKNGSFFQVTVMSNSKGYTLNQWVKNYKESSDQDAPLIDISGKTFFGSNPAMKIRINTLSVPGEILIASLKNDYLYLIRYSDWEGISKETRKQYEAEKLPAIFTQILSTFRFIDQDVTGDFVCPDSKILDCSPCTSSPCPMFNPQYCSKGSPQYNWITENCPNVSIIGI